MNLEVFKWKRHKFRVNGVVDLEFASAFTWIILFFKIVSFSSNKNSRTKLLWLDGQAFSSSKLKFFFKFNWTIFFMFLNLLLNWIVIDVTWVSISRLLSWAVPIKLRTLASRVRIRASIYNCQRGHSNNTLQFMVDFRRPRWHCHFLNGLL